MLINRNRWTNLKNSFILSPSVKNATWIIGGKIIQILISFVVSLLTARYLGPTNYGLINYATSYIAFFTAFSTLGINSILVMEFVEKPEKQGEIVGTTLVLRGLSSCLSVITIFSIVSIIDRDEATTILVVLLCSLQLVFNIFDTFDYWFQSRLQSKIPSIAKTIAIFIVSAYRVLLLVSGKGVEWFAFTASLEFISFAIILIILYFRQGGQSLRFSFERVKRLLRRSYHFILSGVMVSVYAHIDKLMIKQMLGTAQVGYYAVSASINSMWAFVLLAIIDSMRPIIMESNKNNVGEYRKNLVKLYSIIIYLSFFVAIFITLFARPIIDIIYGNKFLSAVPSLQILTWSTVFTYLGVARNIWIVCENKQKYLKHIYVIAAFLNVVLNFTLIPAHGLIGAAITAVITQIGTCYAIPSIFPEMRAHNRIILDALLLRLNK